MDSYVRVKPVPSAAAAEVRAHGERRRLNSRGRTATKHRRNAPHGNDSGAMRAPLQGRSLARHGNARRDLTPPAHLHDDGVRTCGVSTP
jgi:hypothetical protein